MQKRIVSIQDQRMILLELRNVGQLGKKKWKVFDDLLSSEEKASTETFAKRCY